jgi:hypothetical protein
MSSMAIQPDRNQQRNQDYPATYPESPSDHTRGRPERNQPPRS